MNLCRGALGCVTSVLHRAGPMEMGVDVEIGQHQGYGQPKPRQAAWFRKQIFKFKKKSCFQQVLCLGFLVHFDADEYGVTILQWGLSFSWGCFLLLQRFLIYLRLGIFCFVGKDFWITGGENIRQNEQELSMCLGRGAVFSMFFPAVEIPLTSLLGIKEYPFGYFFTFPKKYFLKLLGQD